MKFLSSTIATLVASSQTSVVAELLPRRFESSTIKKDDRVRGIHGVEVCFSRLRTKNALPKISESASSESSKPSSSKSSSESPSGESALPAAPSVSSQPTVDVSDEEIEEILEEMSNTTVHKIQQFLKPFANIVKATPTCHTGTPKKVKKACIGCCTEADSCGWEGRATVCDGACTGTLACNNIPSKSVIMERSCAGEKACQNVGSNSGAVNTGDADYVSLFVARDSCVRTDTFSSPVCQAMGASAQSVIVGSNSCKPEGSCAKFGEKTNGTIFVRSGSCDGIFACSSLAMYAVAADIQIGLGACTGGRGACASMARNSKLTESIAISDGSCNGLSACAVLGLTAAPSITVDKQSCRGSNACNGLGIEATGNITIGSYSCRDGDLSCRYLGCFASNITVGDGSCVGSASVPNVCRFFGSNFKRAFVAVQDGVCTFNSTEQCNGFTYGGDPLCLGSTCTHRSSSFVMVAGGNCADLCD